MATIFYSGLEGGSNGTALTVGADGGNSGFTAKTGTWTFTSAKHADGTLSATASASVSTVQLVLQHTDAPVSTRYYDWVFQTTSFDGGYMLSQVADGATILASLWYDAAGKIIMKNGSPQTQVAITGGAANTSEWMRIQHGVSGTSQTARIWVSSTFADLFNLAQTYTITGAYSGATWDRIKLGVLTTHSAQVWLDRVYVDNSTWPTSGASGNQPPVAAAGTDQSVAAAAVVTVNGSGSTDPDGTIASYQWVQVSGPVVALSGTGSSRTFNAPSLSTASDIVLGLRVTDNDGSQSTQDQMTVHVAASTGTGPTEDFVELMNGVLPTVTATTSNTAFDSIDSAFKGTSSAIGEGSGALTLTSTALAVATHIIPGGTAISSGYLDCVFETTDITIGILYLLRFNSGSTTKAYLRVNTDGTLALRVGGAVPSGGTSSGTVASNAPFRAAVHLDATGTPTVTARVWKGSNLWGTTADFTWNCAYTGGGTFDRISIGHCLAPTASTTTIFDSLRFDDTDWPAPIGGGTVTPTFSNIKRLSGGAWGDVTLNMCVSGAWT